MFKLNPLLKIKDKAKSVAINHVPLDIVTDFIENYPEFVRKSDTFIHRRIRSAVTFNQASVNLYFWDGVLDKVLVELCWYSDEADVVLHYRNLGLTGFQDFDSSMLNSLL